MTGTRSIIEGMSLKRTIWDFEKRDKFVHLLSDFQLRGDSAEQMTDSFLSQLGHTAKQAELKSVTGSHRPRSCAPFFDDECRRLKACVRQARNIGAQTEEIKAREREYHSHVRAKKRKHATEQLRNLLQEKHSNPRKFWKRLQSNTDTLPPQLESPSVWLPYIKNLANPNLPSDCVLPTGAYPQLPQLQAFSLNSTITSEEVLKHLKLLNNGRSPGHNGLPSELLRYAIPHATPECPSPQHKLVQPLTCLLNMYFSSGHIPESLNHSLITPVYKKGDKTDTSNYRPIAVSDPILRLYASILNTRLIEYTESLNLRAPSQAGFRPKLSTLHPLMTLQHFIDKHFHQKKHLFGCFLDLKAAYDSIQRPLLWLALCRLGINSQMLAAIQSLYTDATIGIKVSNTMGIKVHSMAGVKQGCPLSPTLFGLFLDGLDRYLRVKCPDKGPHLRDGTASPLLMYADDIALMASNSHDLQCLINATCQFCTSVGLTINPQKSCSVTFAKQDPQVEAYMCGISVIPHVSSTKYLGLELHESCGLTFTCQLRKRNMDIAYVMLQRKFAGLRCSVSLPLILELYNSCVVPVGCYGCELWGSAKMKAGQTQQRQSIATEHFKRLKRMAGMRVNTPLAIVSKELGTSPLGHVWLERQVTFWDNLQSLPPHSFFRKILHDNAIDSIRFKTRNWVRGLYGKLKKLKYNVVNDCNLIVPIDKACLKSLLKADLEKDFKDLSDCPRTCDRDGAISCTYANWFERPKWSCPDFLQAPVHISLMRFFIKFRTSCHQLPIIRGRSLNIPRSQRVCPACNTSAVCDELHLIFECPSLGPIREKYNHLFSGNITTVKQFVWQDNVVQVMLFLRECFAHILD